MKYANELDEDHAAMSVRVARSAVAFCNPAHIENAVAERKASFAMRLCKDCKHFRKRRTTCFGIYGFTTSAVTEARCGHPTVGVDPVHGGRKGRQCIVERHDPRGLCGPHGKLWEGMA